MKYRSSDEIRKMFFEYFEGKNHSIEPSASLVPVNDNTLLWINSGVAALKKYFDGSVKPKSPRIANIQKSLRTNDIDNVGKTARHHTFFEMMGNFSIGDYFKEEAIGFAYEFLFSENWLGLDLDKMYVSVHTNDDEAYRIWTEKYNVDPARILRTDDNFWQIGNGPCGPNSEIFYDRGEKYDPENIGERLFFEDIENDRYIEVWNIVFSQYDGVEGEDPSTFKELPQKNIDTGMGFERLVSIVQEVDTNFDSDIFMPIIQKIEALSNTKYSDNVMAYRVISDHIRALVFALSDGALFSNEGRGYVLRRLLRRAVRYGKVLGIDGMFMNELVDAVIEAMGDGYPYLKDKQDLVTKLIRIEEERFLQTLADGESLLEQALNDLTGNILSGEVAFKLYDTYGFPIELTIEIAQEKGINVDIDVFNEQLQLQKERARKGRNVTDSMQSQNEDMLNFKEYSEFIYDDFEVKGKVIGVFSEGKLVDELLGEGYVVFDKSVFYSESGGQVSDQGTITIHDAVLEVLEVKKTKNGSILHKVTTPVVIKVNDEALLSVDVNKRLQTRKNHSAVHLLQSALKQILGDHINQAGSFVNDEYFRFDFTHFEKINDEQLHQVQQLINTWIAQTLPITTQVMDLESAKQTGAMALFEENYGEKVRVVRMGEVSKELCGGTHAINTSELGSLVLLSEESVGSGVRRIVGTTGIHAYEYLLGFKDEHDTIKNYLKIGPQNTILDRLESLESKREEMQRKLDSFKSVVLNEKIKEYKQRSITHNDLSYVIVEDKNNEDFKELIEKVGQQVDVVFGINSKTDTLQLIVNVSEKGLNQHKANELLKVMCEVSDGKGGGKPTFAQGIGKNIDSKVAIIDAISNKLGFQL